MLLSEAIKALCVATRADGRSPRTVQAYHEKLGYLVDFLGDVRIEEVTIHDLRRYIADLMDRQTRWADHPHHAEVEGGLSPFTIASRVRALKRLFNWLEAEEILQQNPARRIKTPEPKRQDPKGIARQDLLALLNTTAGGSVIDLRDRAILYFLADTGCRIQGLCGLRVQDVDLVRGLAVVREKGDKTRLVPFTRTTAQVLQDWLRVRPQDRGPTLFVGLGNRAKDEITSNGVAKMLKQRAKRAGVEGPVNPHAFRHAFARDFILHGGDLGTLSDLLGHTSVVVTKAYYGIFTVGELQRKHQQHSPIAQMFEDSDDGK